jgi:hypothetical protein
MTASWRGGNLEELVGFGSELAVVVVVIVARVVEVEFARWFVETGARAVDEG